MQKVKISTFLTERKERMSPDDANNSGLSRIEKINFSGEFFINESKQTNTWMIVVYPNDLVISGINVAKWCLGIYKGNEKVLATIHYSCYEYDLEKIDLEYLKRFVKSSVFQNTILEQTKWWIKTEIKAKTFLNLEITLPSIEHQKSIVQRLERFNAQNWDLSEKINHSSTLIKSLRQSILSDAIAGKLVPQDPTDEPASILLQKIQAEKAKLIAEGKLKKQKSLDPIREDEKPFELPQGWEWVKLGEISNNIHYWYTASAENINTWVKMLRITDIQDNKVNRNIVPFCSISENDLAKMKLAINDILIARTGWTVWKTFLIKNMNEISVFASYLIRVILSSKNFPDYIKLFLESPSYWNQLIAWVTGSAQPNVNAVTLGNLVLPLPPLAEQHRIVAKVDALMQLCNQLEAQITDTKQQGDLLMKSMMQEIAIVEEKKEIRGIK